MMWLFTLEYDDSYVSTSRKIANFDGVSIGLHVCVAIFVCEKLALDEAHFCRCRFEVCQWLSIHETLELRWNACMLWH